MEIEQITVGSPARQITGEMIVRTFLIRIGREEGSGVAAGKVDVTAPAAARGAAAVGVVGVAAGTGNQIVENSAIIHRFMVAQKMGSKLNLLPYPQFVQCAAGRTVNKG